jgi:PAS domain S-box-containing protein
MLNNTDLEIIQSQVSGGDKLKYSLDVETFLKILENSYDEIFVLDQSERVIYVNCASERHYGMKASEILGKTISELNKQGYWYPTITPYVRKNKNKVTLEQTTFTGRKLLTTVTPVVNNNDEIELFIFNSRDITQLELMKQELTAKLKELNYIKNDKNINEFESLSEIIAHSIKMKEIIKLSELFAGADINILLLGESGTGKGLLAKHIHRHSLRKDGPFLPINCAAIPEDLLESELFGYSGGAFTGAIKGGKKGLIEMADKGSLFLDEIAELSPRLQAKLLQFVQDRTYIPIGSTEIKTADVRILTATNQNLYLKVREGKFRQDLLFRLNIVEINIPPLRERPEDILALTSFFIGKFNKKYNVSRELSKEAVSILCRYSWPGNVRELENFIERLVVAVQEHEIKPRHLNGLQTQIPDNGLEGIIKIDDSFPTDLSFDLFMEKVTRELIVNVAHKYGSSRKVAKALKISPSKAARLMRKYLDDCQLETSVPE